MIDPLLQKLSLTDKRARYDKEALLILSDRRLMACLLKEVVPEVKFYTIEEIETFIDGEPRIDEVGLHPSSNSPSRIRGNANESKILGEGTTRFDLWFNLDIPGNNGVIRIIINVEAQNDENYYIGTMVDKKLNAKPIIIFDAIATADRIIATSIRLALPFAWYIILAKEG